MREDEIQDSIVSSAILAAVECTSEIIAEKLAVPKAMIQYDMWLGTDLGAKEQDLRSLFREINEQIGVELSVDAVLKRAGGDFKNVAADHVFEEVVFLLKHQGGTLRDFKKERPITPFEVFNALALEVGWVLATSAGIKQSDAPKTTFDLQAYKKMSPHQKRYANLSLTIANRWGIVGPDFESLFDRVGGRVEDVTIGNLVDTLRPWFESARALSRKEFSSRIHQGLEYFSDRLEEIAENNWGISDAGGEAFVGSLAGIVLDLSVGAICAKLIELSGASTSEHTKARTAATAVEGALQWLYAYPTLSEKDVFKKAKKMRRWIKGRAKLESLLCSLWPFYQVKLRIVSSTGLTKHTILVEGIYKGLGEARDAFMHNIPSKGTVGTQGPFIVSPELLLGKHKQEELIHKSEFPEDIGEIVLLPPILQPTEIKDYIYDVAEFVVTGEDKKAGKLLLKAIKPKLGTPSPPAGLRNIEIEAVSVGLFVPIWVVKYLCKESELYFCFVGREKSAFVPTHTKVGKALDITEVICTNEHIASRLEK